MKILKKLTSSLIATLLLFSATFSYGTQYYISNETRSLPDSSIPQTVFSNIVSYSTSTCGVFDIRNSNVTFNQATSFLNNGINGSWSNVQGGAIYNKAEYGANSNIFFNDTAIFEGNAAQSILTIYTWNGAPNAYGGAIYNYINSNSTSIIAFNGQTVFKNNIAKAEYPNTSYWTYAYGGAIYNYTTNNSSSTITFNNTVTFEGNKAQATVISDSYGGAIYNYIYNSTSTIKFDGQTKFVNNSANGSVNVYGGAIYNYGNHSNSIMIFDDITTFEKNSVQATTSNNSSNVYGGAIYNYGNYSNSKMVFNNTATFEENIAQATSNYSSAYSYGGAIYNYAYDNNSNATITFNGQTTFKNNIAKSEYTGSNWNCFYSCGGAIYNKVNYSNSNGTITFKDLATFEGNTSQATNNYSSSCSYGGAIYNYRDYDNNSNATITFEDGAIFRNNKAIAQSPNGNSADVRGGAIYNEYGTINLVAKTNDVLFEGNKAQSSSNSGYGDAIYNYYGTINLWASNEASIIFNDSVYSSAWGSDRGININKPNDEGRPTTGTIYFNAQNNYFYGNMYLYGGTVKIGENGSFTGDDNHSLSLYVEGDTTLDLANNKVQKDGIYYLRGNSSLYLKIDVDSENNVSDMLSICDIVDDVTIVIDDINLVDTTVENVKEFETLIFESNWGYDLDPIVVLSEGVKEKFHLDLPEGTFKNEEVTKDVSWDKEFHVQEGYATRDLVVDDYILKLVTVGTWKDTEEVLGDTLNLVNTLESKSQKTFNFDSAYN